MRRQINEGLLNSLREELNSHPTKKEWVSYQCTLVTPMYGGGVNAGEVDKEMPIRASAIRGQLRFWWRIACGPKDSKALFEKRKLFGVGLGVKRKRVRWRFGLHLIVLLI
ncbi:type III-B CRISPR module RAMP protein Cmr1 [Vibrio sp. PP-XX7]